MGLLFDSLLMVLFCVGVSIFGIVVCGWWVCWVVGFCVAGELWLVVSCGWGGCYDMVLSGLVFWCIWFGVVFVWLFSG